MEYVQSADFFPGNRYPATANPTAAKQSVRKPSPRPQAHRCRRTRRPDEPGSVTDPGPSTTTGTPKSRATKPPSQAAVQPPSGKPGPAGVGQCGIGHASPDPRRRRSGRRASPSASPARPRDRDPPAGAPRPAPADRRAHLSGRLAGQQPAVGDQRALGRHDRAAGTALDLPDTPRRRAEQRMRPSRQLGMQAFDLGDDGGGTVDRVRAVGRDCPRGRPFRAPRP